MLQTSNIPNFNRSKLKFWFEGRFLGFDFKFHLKKCMQRQVLTKNASFYCYWSSTVSIDGHHGSKERFMFELLVLKDNLYDYALSHKISLEIS